MTEKRPSDRPTQPPPRESSPARKRATALTQPMPAVRPSPRPVVETDPNAKPRDPGTK